MVSGFMRVFEVSTLDLVMCACVLSLRAKCQLTVKDSLELDFDVCYEINHVGMYCFCLVW